MSVSATILIAVVSLLTGGSVTYKLTKNNGATPPPVSQQEQVFVKEAEISAEVVSMQLLQVPCSKEFIVEKGDGLCRELYCRMSQRGSDATTSQKECETISHLNNAATILQLCTVNKELNLECTKIFRERI